MYRRLLPLLLALSFVLCTGCRNAEENDIAIGTTGNDVIENAADTETAEQAVIFCGNSVFADVRTVGEVCCTLRIPVLMNSDSVEITGWRLDGIENISLNLGEISEPDSSRSYGGYFYTELPVTIELSEGECMIRELTFFVNGEAVKCEFPYGLHFEVCSGSEAEFPVNNFVIQATIPQTYDFTMADFTFNKKAKLLQAELYSNEVVQVLRTQIATADECFEWEEGTEIDVSKEEQAQITFEFEISEDIKYLSGPMTIYVSCSVDDENYVMYNTTYKEAVSTAEDVPGFVKAILE